MISTDVLASCCKACFAGICPEHSPAEMVWMAASEAGCSLEGKRQFAPGHRLVYDGEFPVLMHLHHEGERDVLVWTREAMTNGDWTFVQSMLAWLEAVHHGWLGD